MSIQESNSQVTIYRNAVKLESEADKTKRNSSSLEEELVLVDTSNELMDISPEHIGSKRNKTPTVDTSRLYKRFIDCRLKEQRGEVSQRQDN